MSRLTVLHINIIGVVVAAIVAAGLYFTLITSSNEAITQATSKFNEVNGRAAKYDTAKRALAQAQEEQRRATAQYAGYQQRYMPVLGYTSDRMSTMMKVFWPNHGKSWPERFIRIVRGFMAREARTNGIVWENPGVLQLGPYGPDPNTINASNVPGEGLGEQGYLHYSFLMTVRARSMAAILRHIRDWTTIRGVGMPVVEGLTLSGNSPNLTATYTVTFNIIMDQDKIPQSDPRVAGQLSAGTGGMGGMGGPGSMGMGGRGPMGMAGPSMMGGGPPMMSGGGMGGPMMGRPMGPGGGMMSGGMGPMSGGAPMMGRPMGPGGGMMSGGGMSGGMMSGGAMGGPRGGGTAQ